MEKLSEYQKTIMKMKMNHLEYHFNEKNKIYLFPINLYINYFTN